MKINIESGAGDSKILKQQTEGKSFNPALLFLLILIPVFLLHLPLLRLPYFWDEAGYYIPAARDLLLTGSFIPRSTVSNAHPPLVMAYLALCWKLAGFSPWVTRSAMLLLAALALFNLFRLAEDVSNVEVATAATLLTAIYPVFFAQSSLAHVDLAAAGLSFGGLRAYFERRPRATALWFALAALAKETAILTPIAILLCRLIARVSGERWRRLFSLPRPDSAKAMTIALLFPLLPLGTWYGYHYSQTGYVFGNPEFFRYNVQATLHPLRVLLALTIRIWQTIGYMQLGLLTAAMLLAMWRPPLTDSDGQRPRIAVHVQVVFLAVIVSYAIAMAFVGGAVLARYLLPAVPLVIVIGTSTLWRRVRYWSAAVLVIGIGFVVGWFLNPPYGFSMEDNLAYRDYILLHEDAARMVADRYPDARVLTAWPASDELTRPYLGYVSRPVHVLRIEDFTVEQVLYAAEARSNFDAALIFSTKYEPAHPLLENWVAWQRLKIRFFGYHRDLPPAAVAEIVGGRIVFSENRHGQWVAVIELEKIEQAQNGTIHVINGGER